MDTVGSATSYSPPSAATTGLSRVPRPLLALVAGLAPALVTLLLIGSHLHASLMDFRPNRWNDQVYYWHQIATFRQTGFDGGYYTVHEKPPRITFFHFGASGPFFPALFGLIAKVTGWQTYTGILLNMVMIALATWGFIWLARLDRLQIVLTGMTLLAITPILMYMPTISQESFHQAAAILLAGIIYVLFQRGAALSLTAKAGILTLFVVMILLRFSWALLLPPCLLLMRTKNSWKQTAAALVVSAMLGAVLIAMFQVSSAPGNNSVFTQFNRIGQSPLEGISQLFNEVILGNIRGSFLNPDLSHLTLNIVQGIQFLIVLAAAVVYWLKSRQRWFHVYNLVSILLASLTFYLPDGYYRVFAPHLLLTLLLLIVSRRYIPTIAIVVAGLLSAGIFLDEYYPWRFNFRQYPEQTTIAETFEEHLTYQPEAVTPWCNTLLINVRSLHYEMTLVPAGIGISLYSAFVAQPQPIKSQYLFITDAEYRANKDQLHVEELAVTPKGNLYRNLDSDCD